MKVAIRCDGNERVGAGHVARCLPLARAFAERGHEVWFSGDFGGFAARMLGDFPRGDLVAADAVIVDSYEQQALPAVPLATIGEAVRYPGAVWIDYHLDRLHDEPTATELPGPNYAPVDPRFAGAGRARDPIERTLVTVGASAAAQALLPELVARAPGEAVVAQGEPLLDLVGEVDAAICGAGMTAYELASAGLPLTLVQLADNQRRVVEGMLREGVAAPTLTPGPNRRGMELFDGRGAARAAEALEQRWSLG